MKLNSLNWKAAAITATSAQVSSLKKLFIFCTFSYVIVFYYVIVNWNIQVILRLSCNYSQTWTNGHLWITITCLQRLPFERPNFNIWIVIFYNITSEQRPPVNNGHHFWVPKALFVHRFDCNCFLFYFIIVNQVLPNFYQ
jgi:hypothetical protein